MLKTDQQQHLLHQAEIKAVVELAVIGERKRLGAWLKDNDTADGIPVWMWNMMIEALLRGEKVK